MKEAAMIKWLNYHHLLYFRIIATEGSIARASERLMVGQPALSSQLKQLEESLGQKLFERKNRSLVITEAGKVALEYADEIFKKGEEFVQIFNEKTLSSKTHYRIGVVDSAPKILACDIAEKAQGYVDDCTVSLVEGTTEELVEQLNQHTLDIVVTNTLSVVGKEEIFSHRVGKQKVAVYGAQQFEDLTNGFPKSLDGKPFILPTKHSKLRYDIEHRFQQLKIQYDLIAEVQDSSVKKLMGEHGRGMIVLPEFAAQQLVNEKKLYKIGRLTDVNEEYWLLSRKRTIKTPITDALIKDYKI
jgi:LysR family transcriptional activator of nhaA